MDAWNEIIISPAASADMTKVVYDTDDDGIVDKAEQLNDGTNSKTISDIDDIEIMALLGF